MAVGRGDPKMSRLPKRETIRQGTKATLMFILFHKRVCGPLANSLFHHRPDQTLEPPSKIESELHKADQAVQQVLDLIAA